MGGEWKECKLGDIANVFTGYPFKSAHYLPSGKGIKVIRGENISEGYLRWENKEKCWSNISPDLTAYLLKKGDIVIGMDGSKVGKNFAIIETDESYLLAQRVARVRAKPQASQAYLRYHIFSQRFTAYVKQVHTGTSIPHISKGQIERFSIILPPLSEQRRIAHILGTLDEKIQLNRQMNETLEAMAQALFKSWFVDFDPVIDKALASGKTIPEPLKEKAALRQALGNQRKPLPSKIDSLFPDEFVESELGWIP